MENKINARKKNINDNKYKIMNIKYVESINASII